MNGVEGSLKLKFLSLEDKPVFDKFLNKYSPEISEFTFTNLFAWRKAYNFSLCFIDDFLLIISEKNKEFLVFDPLCPLNKKKGIIEKVLSRTNGKAKFIRLPQETAALFNGASGLRIEEDRDSFDYVYGIDDLINLSGAKFDGKRNFIKRFKAENVFSYKDMTQGDTDKCLNFEEEWCLVKDCQRTEGLSREKEAMEEMLKNFGTLEIKGAMILINDKVEAVTLGEALNKDTFVVHMEKANGAFIGIYQAINQMFLQALTQNFKYVNREQDLGVAGLRQAKESYHPCKMIKKYNLVNA